MPIVSPRLVPDGGVGECEVGFLKVAPTLHEERDVLHVDGFACVRLLHDREEIGTDLRPDIEERATERPRRECA